MTTHEVRSKLAKEIKMWRHLAHRFGQSTTSNCSVHALRTFSLLFPKDQP